MRKVFAMAAVACALPLFVSAQAGFPEKPLWVSHGKPVAGEEISLYTVLYNGTDATIEGSLGYFVDAVKYKTENVSLAAQSSTVFSTKWTAVSGTHTLDARFESGGGTTPPLRQQTASIQVTVAEPPPPPPPSALQQNVSKATEIAGSITSSSAPFVQQVAQAVFTQTEAFRNAGAEKLEGYIANLRNPSVAGSSTSAVAAVKGFGAPATSSSGGKSGSALRSAAQTAAAAAHFVFRSIYLFYILFAVLVFGLLTWAYRRLRRPHR